MHLTLIRRTITGDSILGELSVNTNFECFTLENLALAIPEGTYEMVLYASPRFKTDVPLLRDVPGRSYIEIHYGNTFKDTEGCILVGRVQGNDDVGQSRIAFSSLVQKMQEDGGPFSITVMSAGVPLS